MRVWFHSCHVFFEATFISAYRASFGTIQAFVLVATVFQKRQVLALSAFRTTVLALYRPGGTSDGDTESSRMGECEAG